MRYCVTGDTLILTDQGLLPIHEISNKKEGKINLNVLSYEGNINKASKFFNSGKHSTINISTKSGYQLEGTLNHPILVWKLGSEFKPMVSWKLLTDIQEGDIALIHRERSLFPSKSLNLQKFHPLNGFKNEVSLPTEMNPDLAFLLGALVSEGSYHQKQILFNNKDSEFYNKVKSIIQSQFKNVQLYERKIKGGCTELSIYEQKAVLFLRNIGLSLLTSEKKVIPFSVLQSKREDQQHFLKALFEGDGSVSLMIDKRHGGKSIQLNYNSKSKILINQIKTVLLNFGIISSSPYLDKRNDCLKLLINSCENIYTFYKKIGFFSERKNKKLNFITSINSKRLSKSDFIPFLNDYLRLKYPTDYISRNNFDRYNSLKKNYPKLIPLVNSDDKCLIGWIIKNNFFFDQITKVIPNNELKEVFSIKVDSNCHSFVANGFINHNTEAKLNKLAEEMLKDIDKNTVDFTDNFDGSLKEPRVLPSKLPNLLVNGSTGIAVGMATSVPPHNLKEVCSAIIATIDHPDISTEELMQIVPGPDFPTGGEVICGPALHYAYAKGKGKVTIKAICEIEGDKIIVKEIPYMVNKAEMIEHIAELVKDKRIPGIRNINDESDQEGIRVVIDVKKDTDPNVVLNQLYEFSRLKVSFGITLLALVNNQPRWLGLKEIIEYHIQHRQEVITRRTQFELDEAQKKVHLLIGLLIALENIDQVIPGIKNSKTVEEAHKFLMNTFTLTDLQAKAILEMRLQKLASLEQEKIREEHQELNLKITEYTEILHSGQKVLSMIKEELEEIKSNYRDERKSKIVAGGDDDEYVDMEELIEEGQVIVTMTNSGYVKRLPIDTYRTQKRGGKGVKATGMKEEDFVEKVYIASTHDHLLFFTDKGQVYWLKVYNVPEGSRQAKGKHISNILEMGAGEKITAIVPVRNFTEGYLFMSTKNGTAKKCDLQDFSNPRRGGIRAINLDEGDSLVGVRYTHGKNEIILATKEGQANRFKEEDIRAVGRTAMGVRGIRLEATDEVVGMLAADEGMQILTLTEKGYGKRTPVSEYRLCNRGGKGVTNIKITDKNGPVKVVMLVDGSEELMVMSKNGIAIRMKCSDISEVGRATQGVRVIRLEEGDELVAAAQVVKEEENGNGNGSEDHNEKDNENSDKEETETSDLT
ncbi:MAG: DNA gyrase subunit A [Candidatus Woesearchaeota archaeon]